MVVLAQVLGSVDGCACGYPHENVLEYTRVLGYEDIHPKVKVQAALAINRLGPCAAARARINRF
jgi:hypothetical protein